MDGSCGRPRPQAADVPPDEPDDEDVEEAAEAAGFASEPDEDDEVVDEEPDVFADDAAGALLDEEPRLSFR